MTSPTNTPARPAPSGMRSNQSPPTPDAPGGAVPGAMARMQAAESFRDQHLDPLPDQFGAVVPEQGLHLRVDKVDQAGVVHDHHGVRRRFK
jgi:hypothetical protein